MDTQKLKEAGIAPEYWEDCYIDADGMIFTPATDENGEIIKNGAQVYNEWVQNVGADTPAAPTTEESVAALILAQAKQESLINELNRTNAQLMLKVAQLEGGAANV